MRIFYCWQSDLPNSVNRGFIEDCLERAAKTISADGSIAVEPVIERDTAGLTGSPDIAETILRRIDEAAIVVADVSLVTSADEKRHTPNPNVLVEVGYALKGRGRDRVILVMNRFYGKPEHLPFDLRRYRVLTYDLPPESSKTDARRVLTSCFVDQIQEVVRTVEASTREPPTVPFDQQVRQRLQADADTVRPMIFEARDTAIEAWRSTEGGSEEAVRAVRDERLRPALNRLMAIGMLAPNYDPVLFREVVGAFVQLYKLGGDQRYGFPRPIQDHLSWTLLRREILRRIYLIGIQLVRDDHLALLPTLVIQRPDPNDPRHLWTRHAHIDLAREGRMPRTKDDVFQEVRAALAEPTLALPGSFDRSPERLPETFARFDFLQYLIAITHEGHVEVAYPSFGGLLPHDLVPLLDRLIRDRALRASLRVPESDPDLASLLAAIDITVRRKFPESNWYGFPDSARTVWDFIQANQRTGRTWT